MEKYHSLHTLIDVQARVMGLGGHELRVIFMEETQKCQAMSVVEPGTWGDRGMENQSKVDIRHWVDKCHQMPFKGNISRSRGAERPGRITKLPPSKPHQCSFTQQAQVILSYQQPPWEKSVVHPSRALSPVSGYPRLSVIARGPVSAPGGESAQLGRKPCLAPEGWHAAGRNSPAAAAPKSLQSCPTLCNPIDGSPPGSPFPGILQARTLEWVAISFSNAWKRKVKVRSLSRVPHFATPWTAACQAPPSMGFSRQEYWSGVPLPSPGTALKMYKQGTHVRRDPRSPARPDSRQGCVSKAISYPTLNSGCSTVVFSSRAHEDSLGDSEKTNKQTKTLSMKNKFIGNIQVCLPHFFSSAMLWLWSSNL